MKLSYYVMLFVGGQYITSCPNQALKYYGLKSPENMSFRTVSQDEGEHI